MTSPGNHSTQLVLTIALPELMDELRAAGCTPVAWPANEDEHRALIARAPEIGAVVAVGSRKLPDGFLDAATGLGIIACMGAGYENYDPDFLGRRNIRLVNAAGQNADDVADLAMGLVIAAFRNMVEADQCIRAGEWRPFIGRRLKGRKLGILGLGSIGRAVAVRAQAFGMDVHWWGPNPRQSDWLRMDEPAALAHWADALAVCCRPTNENENLVGDRILDALGPQGVLVNVARGSLVDEDALIEALRQGRIAAAGLDVFKDEPTDHRKWLNVPNLTLHPHCGGGTTEALADGRRAVVENVRRYFAGEDLLDPLN
tara:strand:+ start:15645 stop:16589 length:945 start_codon:yes stop_codon:yes gene_type:complete